jgi:DNA-binding Lrp family transcriptional regulator
MPFQLDDYDVSILQALLNYGRKSFREISRETGITTPTVKARFAAQPHSLNVSPKLW